MDNNDVLKRYLGKAWELGVDMAGIAHLSESGATHAEVKSEAEHGLGTSEPVSAWLDSLLPSAPRPDTQPKRGQANLP